MASYSFTKVQASIVGPGGAFSLGSGAGVAEEGIDIVMNGDKTTLTIGADGSGMYSLLADNSGKVTVRLLKNSPVNAKLMALYDAQSLDPALWGQNTITITNTASGDVNACRQVAFLKKADQHFAKEGGIVEWEFLSVNIDSVLGVY